MKGSVQNCIIVVTEARPNSGLSEPENNSLSTIVNIEMLDTSTYLCVIQ